MRDDSGRSPRSRGTVTRPARIGSREPKLLRVSSKSAGSSASPTPPFRRVRLRYQRHRSCGQGMTAKTTPPSGDAQKPWGGHPSCAPAPLTTSFGTVGQWERRHRAMVERTKGAATQKPSVRHKGAATQKPTSKKRNSRSNLGARGRVPRTLALWRHLLLQVVAATSGGTSRAPPAAC